MKLAFSVWVVLALVTNVTRVQAQPALKFENGFVHVTGLSLPDESFFIGKNIQDWQAILSVYTQAAYLRKIDQPVEGNYQWINDAIIFQPAYPFSPGEMYHAIFTTEVLNCILSEPGRTKSERFELTFSIPAVDMPATIIESIYPESAELPANMLRMYIYFSSPMMPGEAYKHIQLLDEDGREVEKAFLVVDQELWDSERKRFTLLFDPGRIKRDLRSNIDLGPPLRQGRKYMLVIDSAWRDVHGQTLAKSIRKAFMVGEAVRKRVDPRNWKTVLPPAGSLGEMHVSFDRPMDRALVLKCIRVAGPWGKVDGRLVVDDDGFSFTPSDAWIEGHYVISILPSLEDVAGNNLNNVFDLDLLKETRINSMEPFDLRVTIHSQPR